jgi:hypothetical protein
MSSSKPFSFELMLCERVERPPEGSRIGAMSRSSTASALWAVGPAGASNSGHAIKKRLPPPIFRCRKGNCRTAERNSDRRGNLAIGSAFLVRANPVTRTGMWESLTRIADS